MELIKNPIQRLYYLQYNCQLNLKPRHPLQQNPVSRHDLEPVTPTRSLYVYLKFVLRTFPHRSLIARRLLHADTMALTKIGGGIPRTRCLS